MRSNQPKRKIEATLFLMNIVIQFIIFSISFSWLVLLVFFISLVGNPIVIKSNSNIFYIVTMIPSIMVIFLGNWLIYNLTDADQIVNISKIEYKNNLKESFKIGRINLVLTFLYTLFASTVARFFLKDYVYVFFVISLIGLLYLINYAKANLHLKNRLFS
jgi:hypothetical protein